MSDKQELIIVRRYEAEEEHHKGGVWKIAHADFMTAMMAFFLVMWLISVADKDTRASVANYFNPVQLAESTPHRKGLEDPNNSTPTGEGDANPASDKSKASDNAAGATGAGKEKGKGEGEAGPAPATQRPRFDEGALFQDPYAVLAKLALEPEQEKPQDTFGVDVTSGENVEPGVRGGEAQRDPFDPLYWQIAPVPRPKSANPGEPGTTTPMPPEAKLDALAPSTRPYPTASKDASKADKGKSDAGNDAQPATKADMAPSDAKNDAQDSALKAEIANAVQGKTDNGPKPHVDVSRTGEGLLISVTDEIDFSMFAIGSAEPQPKVVRAMEKIAKIISARPGKIIIRGHTDGRPFKSETYDNWRLSTARAHMASYMLVRGGIDEARIERVEGHADRSLKKPADPNAAENRRIEILLRERP
jgi:chemotaxis protein MotB